MKRVRFPEEQIIGTFGAAETAGKIREAAASTTSRSRRSTAGDGSTVGWRCRRRRISANSSERTES